MSAKKGKQVAFSTIWRLRENVVLRLMDCLTPTFGFDIFMDNYFTSFRLLTHLGVNNIRAAGVLNKNMICKCTFIGNKELLKKERGHFEQRTSSKKKLCNFDLNDSSAVYIAFSESCEPKRFVWCGNKVERKYIQEQQPNQFHCYNQNMGFVNRMD